MKRGCFNCYIFLYQSMEASPFTSSAKGCSITADWFPGTEHGSLNADTTEEALVLCARWRSSWWMKRTENLSSTCRWREQRMQLLKCTSWLVHGVIHSHSYTCASLAEHSLCGVCMFCRMGLIFLAVQEEELMWESQPGDTTASTNRVWSDTPACCHQTPLPAVLHNIMYAPRYCTAERALWTRCVCYSSII